MWLVGLFCCCCTLTWYLLRCFSIQIVRNILTGFWSPLECFFDGMILKVCIVCPVVLHKSRNECTKLSETIWRTAHGRRSQTCSVPSRQSPSCELLRPRGIPRLCSGGKLLLPYKRNFKKSNSCDIYEPSRHSQRTRTCVCDLSMNIAGVDFTYTIS